jgi:stage II sporulation protein D
MIHPTAARALEAEATAVARVRAYLFLAIWPMLLLSQLTLAQEFRVQIVSSRLQSNASQPIARKPLSRLVAVDLDAYVEGALAGEASVLKNGAALQAMAILVRTWAWRYQGRHQAQGFDFCALTHCQVFRLPDDRDGRYPLAIIDAVSSTRNQVLQYHGQLADPYFTADCGGVTESAANLWPDRDFPYLPSVPDPYCAASRHSNWQREIPLERLAPILRDELGLPLRGPVRDLAVGSRDSSGRAFGLEVLADATFSVDANQLRYAVGRQLGWDILKSNLYTIERHGDTVVFRGHGLGHGVGLCQAGADAMAGLGIGYEQILAYYFPGTMLAEITPRLAPPFRRASPCRSNPDPIASSEHFELAYPGNQTPWVSRTLNQLESWRRVLAEQADLGAGRIRVRTWDTTAEYIRATGEPGWVGGSSDGQSIFLQPLRTLTGKGILNSTLRHELTHVAVHRVRPQGVPEWFEEGLVLYLTGEHVDQSAQYNRAGRTLGEALARPQSAAEMRSAFARAASLVRQLAAQRGQNGLWQVLEHPSADDLKWLRSEAANSLAP